MKIGIFDLDAMLHIVANVQYSQGNRDNVLQTQQHVARFFDTICRNSKVESYIAFYQKADNQNFRNDLLPEYKGHRTTTDAILCWKADILLAFDKIGAVGLQYVESDDALATAATLFKTPLLVSSDKDMVQVPTEHYNPFKKGPVISPDRWKSISKSVGMFNLMSQALSGDPTDMPNELCGLPGIGDVKSKAMIKKCKTEEDYFKVIQTEYTKRFPVGGKDRALITYQMVRLLDGSPQDWYANEDAKYEIAWIKKNIKEHIIQVKNPIVDLFPSKAPLLDLLSK